MVAPTPMVETTSSDFSTQKYHDWPVTSQHQAQRGEAPGDAMEKMSQNGWSKIKYVSQRVNYH